MEVIEENKSVVVDPLSESDSKLWALFCHLGFIIGFSFIAPLVIWLIFKDRSEFVDHHGKEALNFNISMIIYFIIAGILCIIFIGIPLLIGLAFFGLVVSIVAMVKAGNGERYNYPMNIKFIK